MNFIKWILTTRVTWAGWQFGVLRFSLIALGIVLGALFAEFWRPYLWLIGLLFVLTAIWAGIMYFRAMHKPA
jgi:hypothetical protein